MEKNKKIFDRCHGIVIECAQGLIIHVDRMKRVLASAPLEKYEAKDKLKTVFLEDDPSFCTASQIARTVTDSYTKLEDALKKIYEGVLNPLFAGFEQFPTENERGEWHKSLLSRANATTVTQINGVEVSIPPIISDKTYGHMSPMLAFRHVNRCIYSEELRYHDVMVYGGILPSVVDSFHNDLKKFEMDFTKILQDANSVDMEHSSRGLV